MANLTTTQHFSYTDIHMCQCIWSLLNFSTKYLNTQFGLQKETYNIPVKTLISLYMLKKAKSKLNVPMVHNVLTMHSTGMEDISEHSSNYDHFIGSLFVKLYSHR
jgi:hypothetical protein